MSSTSKPSDSLLGKERHQTNDGDASHTASDDAQPPIFKDQTTTIVCGDALYQSALTEAECEAMRKIQKQRSSDLLPSVKDSVDLLTVAHFGLLVNYACIGFLNGFLPAIIYPFFKMYLNMEGYQVAAAGMIVQLPWSYKTLFGFLSDHRPIFGYRRKSYIIIGWFMSFAALMVLAYEPHQQPYFLPGEIRRTQRVSERRIANAEAPHSGSRYLVFMMFVCVGFVLSDVACDGLMVELAQHEHIDVRGTLQSTIYIVRYAFNLIAGIFAAVCFNGQEYGGSFDWHISYNSVFFVCGLSSIIGIICTLFFLEEEETIVEEEKSAILEMWRIFKQRAIWQLMAYHFLNSFFHNFGISCYTAIQEYWARVTPLNNSISTCFSSLLFVVATLLMKYCFLNTNWRLTMLTSTIFTIVVNFSVNFIVTFDVYRDQWFYLGGPQIAIIPDGMRHIIAGFVTTEIAEHGFESATYSLLTTVHNLAAPFTSSMTNIVDGHFDVTDKDIATDTMHVRWEVATVLFIAMIMQLASIPTLLLLPRQKLQAQELKYHGKSSACAGALAVVGLIIALAWSTTMNLLSIDSETACLRIAGGQGCK